MKTLLLLLPLLMLQEKTWHCSKCDKDVPAAEVKVLLCKDPHNIVHVRDCSAMRHTVCRAEVTPILGIELKAESPNVTPDTRALFLASDGAAEGSLKGKSVPLTAGKDAHVYVLLGLSGNGADPLRAASARADYDARARTVRVILRTVAWAEPPQVGTADACWIGWRFPLGKLDAGDIKLVVFEEVANSQRPGTPVKSISTPTFVEEKTFSVK
jgi:hypothetical protein